MDKAKNTYKKGDIICSAHDQSFLRVVIHVEEKHNVIWCAGLIIMGLMKDKEHPDAFPIYLDDPDVENLKILGNLDDYKRLVDEYEQAWLKREADS